MLDKRQRLMRQSGIGASEIAAVCGMSRWKAPIDIFMVKRRLVKRSKGHNATHAGLFLEDGIARWTAKKTGWRIHGCGCTYRHRKHRWMLCSPDRFKVQPRGKRWHREALVEVKTSGYPEDWGSEGTDQIPLEIRLQCQQQLSVMRCFQPKMALNYVPVFFLPNREHRIYCVEHSPELEEAIIYAGESFWTDNVEAGVAPEFDTSSESAAKYIAAVCHQTSRAIVKAPPAADQWIEQLTQANIAIDVAERFKNAAEYQLRKLVGANKGIEGDWGRYLWYMRQSGGTDWKALAQEMFAVLRAAGIGNVQGQAKLIENHQRPGTRVPRFTPRKGEG